MEKEWDLKKRTKRFALDAMKLVESLPKNMEGRVIGNQLLRSATSVGANYRAACKGRSKQEFIAKLGTVEEEADEIVAIMPSSRKSAAERTHSAIGIRKSDF